MCTVRVSGVVRGLGKYYASGLESMEIQINPQAAVPLRPVLDQRYTFSLEIGNVTYTAGLRATQRNPYVWICPDLMDSNGKKLNLAEALRNHGFAKNQRVTLVQLSGHMYRLI